MKNEIDEFTSKTILGFEDRTGFSFDDIADTYRDFNQMLKVIQFEIEKRRKKLQQNKNMF